MPMICICSPQGGSGRTTLAANLADTLAQRGNKVLLIDFDVQNALRLHFNVSLSEVRGFAPYADTVSDWSQFIMKVDTNLYLLPYGEASWQEHQNIERLLRDEPQAIAHGLENLKPYNNLVTIVDVPAGPNMALMRMREICDLHIVTLLADAQAPVQLKKIKSPTFPEIPINASNQQYYVINQTDPRYEMSHDIDVYLRQTLGDKLLGGIHRDSAISAALCNQKTLRQYRPASTALFDIEAITQKVSDILNITVGDNGVMPT